MENPENPRVFFDVQIGDENGKTHNWDFLNYTVDM